MVPEAELGVEVTPADDELALESDPALAVPVEAEDTLVGVVLLLVATDGVAAPVVGTVSAGAPVVLSAVGLLDPQPATAAAIETAATAKKPFATTAGVI